MANITIRNLDEAVKQAIRERAAANGRSMEEEVRICLAGLTREKAGEKSDEKAGQAVLLPASNSVAARAAASADIAAFPAAGRKILLVITGGVAAYKSLDLIRRLRERGCIVQVVMTAGAQRFITPLAASAISGGRVYTDLFDQSEEHDVGHIRLTREADLVVVAPATADFLAKMAHGLADELASATLLACNKQVLVAPAMNPAMWSSPATRRNVAMLKQDGINFVGPNSGEMAESNEAGRGRMAEPLEIVAAIGALLDTSPKPLKGKRVIMTSGPTHEPIDPVRYIANRSSGKQGQAIAASLARAGAEVFLVSGPVNIADPDGVHVIHVESAREMRDAVEALLPADIAIMVAAVADWRSADSADQKMKKQDGKGPGSLQLTENPDILKGVGHHENRPALVIGFAAETRDVETYAKDKLIRKGADWIVANDVSKTGSIKGGVMGGDRNRVHLVTRQGVEAWPELSKGEVADRLVAKIIKTVQVETIET